MDELTAFITARLDEDEAAAEAVGPEGPKRKWSLCGPPEWPRVEDDDENLIVTGDKHTAAIVDHIGRHDPARVLREVAAKRAILALHHPEYTEYVDADGDDRSSVDCAEDGAPGTPDSWPCPTIRHLAAVWADHPDYRPEWKP